MEENRGGLKMKVCFAEKVYVSEEKKIITDTLNFDVGSTSFC